VALFGFAVPLLTLAGSAVAYVVKLYQDAAERRRNQFFELMQFIDSERPIATKVAAIYELRRFPEHKEFIIRFCETQKDFVTGGSAPTLILEMEQTRKFMQTLDRGAG
jgi:hypothetical protein